MEAILETKKLSHIYSAGTPFERAALADVDFAAYPGEYLGIIGHTGSGKSTLIQHLNGLLKPTSGQVLFQGTDIWTDLKTTRRTRFQVGLVFQYPEYQLFEETVRKDISFGCRAKHRIRKFFRTAEHAEYRKNSCNNKSKTFHDNKN